jgi:hypothetical protein
MTMKLRHYILCFQPEILIEINGSMIVTFQKDQQILKGLTLLVHKPLEFEPIKPVPSPPNLIPSDTQPPWDFF